MDILNPSTYWIGNRCYRVLTHQVENSHYNYAEEDSYSEENVYNDEAECGGDGSNEEYTIEQMKNGKFRTDFHVSSTFFPLMIGARGATKRRLEQEADCIITIPPRGVSDHVAVTANTPNKVRIGRLKVDLLVEHARNRLPPTHFVSIPVNTQDMQDNFKLFKARVLGKCGLCRGVVDQVFQEPCLLHLTLGVMVLLDDAERIAAVQALTAAVADNINLWPTGPLRVQGLHYFNDDPSEVKVLYAGIKTCDADKDAAPHQLQTFADALSSSMLKAGVLKKEKSEKVKLHVTLLNTSFLQRSEDADGEQPEAANNRNRTNFIRETFDAREILENFGDFEFGLLEVKELHLSVMHSRDHTVGGYYTATTVVPLTAAAVG